MWCIFSGDSGQQQWTELLARPEIMTVNNPPTCIHSVLVQSLCFSLSVYLCSVTAVMSDSLQPYGLKSTRLLCPWNSPGKIMGVACHVLLQGIFLIQGLNPSLLRYLHWQASSLPWVPPGSPTFSSVQFSSVQSLSNIWLFATPCSTPILVQYSRSCIFSTLLYKIDFMLDDFFQLYTNVNVEHL